MARTRIEPELAQAINRQLSTPLGRKYDRWARRTYGITGKQVIGRTTAAEFGGRSTRSGRGVTSSAGARGPAQFIPSTRQAFIRQYGVDPWKNDLQAVKGMMLHHLKHGGIAGYNPGMPSYQGLVLGQRTTGIAGAGGRMGRGGLRGRRGGAGQVSSTQPQISREGFDPGGGGDVIGVLAEALKQRPQMASAGVQAPPFAAGPVFPGGYQPVQPSPMVVDDSLDEALMALATLRGSVPPRSTVSPGQVRSTLRAGKARSGTGRSALSDDTLFEVRKDGWKGAKAVGVGLVRVAMGIGLEAGSQKRSTKHTASGGVSDHWEGNRDSFAWDMFGTTQELDRSARKLAKLLGVDWSGGSWLSVNKTIDGRPYRFQMGWRVAGHAPGDTPHLHLGIDRVDTPG